MTSEGPTDTQSASRGSGVYLAGSAVSMACALLRYTVMARILGPEQLGLAATLLLTMQFFDLLMESGSDRLMIQDPKGGTVAAQALVQLVFVCRGLVTTSALVLIAAPVSAAMGRGQLAAGFMLLAIAPLVGGFLHLDMRRDQRSHDFRSEGWAMIASESASIIVTVACCVMFRTFTAAAAGLIARNVVLVLVSHLRAHRRYQLGLSRAFLPKLTRFAIPLIVNGILLFAAGQGDRVMIGQRLGLEQLGAYSATILLIFYPATLVHRFLSGVNFPRIAGAYADLAQQDRNIRDLLSMNTTLAIAMVVGFSVVAPMAIGILYGAKFHPNGMTIALVGALQTTRFMRATPITTALALGRSRIVLAGTICSLSGWPLAVGGLMWIGGLDGVVCGFLAGETLALILPMALIGMSRRVKSVSNPIQFLVAAAIVVAWRLPTVMQSPLTVIGLAGLTLLETVWIIRSQSSTALSLIAICRHKLAGVGRLLGLQPYFGRSVVK